MKLNELKPVDQINLVVEVVEIDDERFYLIRLSNGVILKYCIDGSQVGSFLDELEFPTAPASKL